MQPCRFAGFYFCFFTLFSCFTFSLILLIKWFQKIYQFLRFCFLLLFFLFFCSSLHNFSVLLVIPFPLKVVTINGIFGLSYRCWYGMMFPSVSLRPSYLGFLLCYCLPFFCFFFLLVKFNVGQIVFFLGIMFLSYIYIVLAFSFYDSVHLSHTFFRNHRSAKAVLLYPCLMFNPIDLHVAVAA